MADQDINIRVDTSQTGPGLKPLVKDLEAATVATKELTKAQEVQVKTLKQLSVETPVFKNVTRSGLASSVNPSAPEKKKAAFTRRRRELDRIADQRHAEEETARREEAKRQSDFEDAAEKALADQKKAESRAAEKGLADAAEHAKALARKRQLSAKSDEKAGRSTLAKELASKVDPESSGEGSGGALRSALRQGAQVAGLRGLGQALASIAGPLGILVAGFAAVAAGVKAAYESFKQFVKVQSEVRSLNQTLAVTGKFSQALSDSLQELAQARERNTGISDDKWIGSFKELLRAGANANTLPQLSQDVESLTAVTGDLGSATKLMASALRGEFEGFKELGIYLDEGASQTQKLTDLSNRLAAAQGVLGAGSEDAAMQMHQLASEMRMAGAGAGQLLSRFILNSANYQLTTAILSTLSSWFGKTTTATANLEAASSKIQPVFLDEAKALHAVTSELEDQKKLMDYIDTATDKKIQRDKASTNQKVAMLEAERAYKEQLIRSKAVDGQLGRPGGIDEFTATKQIGMLNEQYQIRKDRAEKDQRRREISDKENAAAAARDAMNSAAQKSQGAEEALRVGQAKQKQIDASVVRQLQIRNKLNEISKRPDGPARAYDQRNAENDFLDERRLVAKLSKGKSLRQLTVEAEAAGKAVDTATQAYKKLQDILEDVNKLKKEDSAADVAAADALATNRIKSKIENREKYQQEVDRFKAGQTRGVPPASASDFAVDPSFRHAELGAGSAISGVVVKGGTVNRVTAIASAQNVAIQNIEGALAKGGASASRMHELTERLIQITEKKDADIIELLKRMATMQAESANQIARLPRN